jgi:transcription antitermination factor NusG
MNPSKLTKIFQGYVLVEMKLTDETWYIVRNTPGSTLAAKRKHFQQKIIRKAQESTTNLRDLQDSDTE